MNRMAKFLQDYALPRFLLPAGVLLLVFGFVVLRTVDTRQGYPQTDTIVTRTELYEEAHDEGDSWQEATYRVFVKYTVDGQEFEEELGILKEMKAGEIVRIDYNPADPRDISQPMGHWVPLGMIAAGTGALLGGVGSAIRTAKINRKLNEQEEEWTHGS